MPHAVNAFGSGKPQPTSVAAFCEDRRTGSPIVETFPRAWAKARNFAPFAHQKQRQSGFVNIGTIFANLIAHKVSKKHLFGRTMQ